MSTANTRKPGPRPPKIESGSFDTKRCPVEGCAKIAFPGHAMCTPCWLRTDAVGRSRIYAAWSRYKRTRETQDLRDYYAAVVDAVPA